MASGRIKTFLVLSVLNALLGGCDDACDKRLSQTPEIDPAWHASKLKEKEFGLEGPDPGSMTGLAHAIATGEPYHVRKLIEAGPRSSQVLIEMLHDDTLTPFTYLGSLKFTGGFSLQSEIRQATLGDIADYALCEIYGVDVGYRSYHDEATRKEAIARWKQVVREKDKRSSREPSTSNAGN